MTPRTMSLPLPAADLEGLRRRVTAVAEKRPGIYRMLDAGGRVLYVGKARQLRTRMLSYFHARYPDDKGARILHAASDLTWEYATSEFAAHLAELREIRKWRPPYNVQMNRSRTAMFVAVAEGPAPKLASTASPSSTSTTRRSWQQPRSPGTGVFRWCGTSAPRCRVAAVCSRVSSGGRSNAPATARSRSMRT